MRTIRFALPLAAMAVATPAMAQDAEAPVAEGSAIAEKLRDPATQATVTATAAILGEVLLDVPVGPLVQAMDDAVDALAQETGTAAPPREDIAPDATMRDMVGPDGDRLATQLATKMPQAMDMAADLAESAEELKPVLEDLGKRLRDALPRALPPSLSRAVPAPERD